MPNTKKYTNHSIDEIDIYLCKIKKQIEKENFIVPVTNKRADNQNFINNYQLTTKKQKNMLMQLEATDFCYSADDYNNKIEKHYIFAKEYELDFWGSISNILVYIKIVQKEDNFVVVISFHEAKKNVKYLFK